MLLTSNSLEKPYMVRLSVLSYMFFLISRLYSFGVSVAISGLPALVTPWPTTCINDADTATGAAPAGLGAFATGPRKLEQGQNRRRQINISKRDQVLAAAVRAHASVVAFMARCITKS